MNPDRRIGRFAACIVLLVGISYAAETIPLTIQVGQPGVPLNRSMWGVFFEDINFGADGGLYAELVKNRSFEFPQSMMGWRPTSGQDQKGKVTIASDSPFNPMNPHYVRIEAHPGSPLGVINEGFRGIGIRAGDKYDFSAQVRVRSGSPALLIQLTDSSGKVLGSEKISRLPSAWGLRNATLRPLQTQPKAELRVLVQGEGTVEVDMVSLFPRATWKNRRGGLRADLVQWLADLKPGFVRFPGGCIVEGDFLTNRYQWKTTIGPVEERKLIVNRWNHEFKHRPTP
ncbi:alpha-L-arabinofuranosidase, partial [bacterium]|nr:alpha-L-arabinofuranosidase [bacterium]